MSDETVIAFESARAMAWRKRVLSFGRGLPTSSTVPVPNAVECARASLRAVPARSRRVLRLDEAGRLSAARSIALCDGSDAWHFNVIEKRDRRPPWAR